MKKAVFFLLLVLVLQSCIVRAPKYTRVEKVMRLKTGMSLAQVDSILDLQPYTIKSLDTMQQRVFIYKFRTNDRRTVPFLLKDTNGKKALGPFMDLHAYFDAEDILYRIETTESSTQVQERRVNIDKIVTFITVTAPAVAVAIGLSKTN